MMSVSPCPDWPVFSDLDNMASRDHDHLDNHRVSVKGGRLQASDPSRGRRSGFTPRVNLQLWRWAAQPRHCQEGIGWGN